MFYDHAFTLQTTEAVKPRQADLQEPDWSPTQGTIMAAVESFIPPIARLQAPGEHTDVVSCEHVPYSGLFFSLLIFR